MLAVTALPSAITGIIDGVPNFTPAVDLHHSQLSTLAGDTVRVTSSAGPPSALTIERVTPATPYVSSNGRLVGDSFSVLFEGPAGAPLAQDTYELHHPSLGAFPMFLSPVDLTDGSSQRYEAVFNRLL